MRTEKSQQKLLILCFYFTPDLSAGSFRMQALKDELAKKLIDDPNKSVEILTTLPNRYTDFTLSALPQEMSHQISIKRFQLKKHDGGFLTQAKNFYHFQKQVRNHIKSTHYDLVFATSSRLFTGFLGARIARSQKAPYFLDIRDIFTETMDSILKFPLKQLTAPIFKWVERYTFSKAAQINFVSEGFAAYFPEALLKNKKISFISNGIDDIFYRYDFTKPRETSPPQKIKVLYAGNIGEGQGLEKIIPDLALRFSEACEFIIVGNGGLKNRLIEATRNFSNVTLLPSKPRNELLELYREADILFVHLNNYPAFERVLPSKIFEYAATHKPILAGIPGYSRAFSEKNIEGCFLFDPCNTAQAVLQLEQILSNPTTVYPRQAFLDSFRRDRLMESLAKKMLDLLNAKSLSS